MSGEGELAIIQELETANRLKAIELRWVIFRLSLNIKFSEEDRRVLDSDWKFVEGIAGYPD